MTATTVVLLIVGVILLLMAIPVLTVVLIRTMVRRRFAPQIHHGVAGEVTVTGIGIPPRHGTNTSELVGLLTIPGQEPVVVQQRIMASKDTWPAVGDRLPVVVDPVNPQRFRVRWELVPSATDAARLAAQRLAANQRGDQA
ncbi:hypothetical protein [Cellulomonas sp. NPDC089187]|uniref:hypothetical protein n=1 Tax=Cellulomonas sp. NPDC089187 TaxID=3154970 RepID=UPI003422987B